MEHLIETVHKYPCLWNTTAIEYRDQELKDAAWAEVMKETDLSSVKEVKLKWKKLRDSYRDALKRHSDLQSKEGAGGAGTSKAKSYPWKYMSLMAFLQPHMSARKKPPPPPANGLGPSNGHGTSRSAGDDDGRSSDDSESEREQSPGPPRSSERLTVIDRKLDFLCKAQAQAARGSDRDRDLGAPDAKRPCVTSSPCGGAGGSSGDPLESFFASMCAATRRLPPAAQLSVKKTLFSCVLAAEEALLAEQQSYAALWARRAASSSSSDEHTERDERKPA